MAEDSMELLRELALHLFYDAEARQLKTPEGKPVGCLVISNEDGALWKRVVDVIGGEPDMIRDVVAPLIKEEPGQG